MAGEVYVGIHVWFLLVGRQVACRWLGVVIVLGTFRVVHDGVQVGWLVVESRAAMVFYGDPPDLWWGRAGRTCLCWESDEELAEWVSSVDPSWSAGFPVGSEIGSEW